MRPLFRMVLLCSLLASCTKESSPETSLLRIRPQLLTRVTSLDFERGDCIGLNVDRASGSYAANAPLTYDGTSFGSTELSWYADRSDGATLTAYYPFSASGFPQRFEIASNQEADLSVSDLLGARSEGVLPTSAAVSMTFRHLLSQLVLTVTNETGRAISSLALSGLKGTATLDWNRLTAAAAEDAAAMTVTPKATDAGYAAILVPQTGELAVEVTTAGDKSYRRTVSVALQGGRRYRLALTLTEEALSLVLSGTIEDWSEGGDPVTEQPEGPQDPEPPQDEVTLTIGTERYALRTIGDATWMAENLRTIPEAVAVGGNKGVWYPSTGSSTVATAGLLYDAATAAALCPSGWHLPTAEELTALIGADTGSGFYAEAGFWQSSLNNHSQKSYLLGTAAADSESHVLLFTADGGAQQVKTLSSTYGFSVRYVRDR